MWRSEGWGLAALTPSTGCWAYLQNNYQHYRGNNNKNPPFRIFGILIFSLRLLFYFFLSKNFLAFIILLFPDLIWATRSLDFRQNLRLRLENTLKMFACGGLIDPAFIILLFSVQIFSCVYYSTFFYPKFPLAFIILLLKLLYTEPRNWRGEMYISPRGELASTVLNQ